MIVGWVFVPHGSLDPLCALRSPEPSVHLSPLVVEAFACPFLPALFGTFVNDALAALSPPRSRFPALPSQEWDSQDDATGAKTGTRRRKTKPES